MYQHHIAYMQSYLPLDSATKTSWSFSRYLLPNALLIYIANLIDLKVDLKSMSNKYLTGKGIMFSTSTPELFNRLYANNTKTIKKCKEEKK